MKYIILFFIFSCSHLKPVAYQDIDLFYDYFNGQFMGSFQVESKTGYLKIESYYLMAKQKLFGRSVVELSLGSKKHDYQYQGVNRLYQKLPLKSSSLQSLIHLGEDYYFLVEQHDHSYLLGRLFRQSNGIKNELSNKFKLNRIKF